MAEAEKIGYMYKLYTELGSTAASSQLISFLWHFLQKVKENKPKDQPYIDKTDWGDDVMQYDVLIRKEDVIQFPAFKHLWGHKCSIWLCDSKMVGHEFQFVQWGD
jgi:hypothetical protein